MTLPELDAFLADTVFAPRDEDDAIDTALERTLAELAEEAQIAAEED